jgi:hypothetical protein
MSLLKSFPSHFSWYNFDSYWYVGLIDHQTNRLYHSNVLTKIVRSERLRLFLHRELYQEYIDRFSASC